MRIRARGHHRGKKHHRARSAALLTAVAAAATVVIGIGHVPEPADAASTAMPTGNVTSNGRVWKPVVSQNFSKNAPLGTFVKTYGSTWAGYSGFSDTSGKGTYDPNRVLSVAAGHLDYYLRTRNGRPVVAAPLPNGYTPQTYGRYAIRFRSDAVAGYKMAFLLWPTSDKWNDGEIDWPDGNLGSRIYPASAIVGTQTASGMKFDKPAVTAAPTMGTGWHTAVTEWTSGHVRWYWDGKLVGQTTKPSGVPTKPMRWTLQAETNTEGKAVSSSAHGHIQVDWVVQYK